MTIADEAVREGSFPRSGRGGIHCGERAAREKYNTAPAAALNAVTERVRKAGQVVSSAAAVLDKPGSLAHSQPPTFRQARDRHHECARHYEALILRWPRLPWGYFHLLVIMPVAVPGRVGHRVPGAVPRDRRHHRRCLVLRVRKP